MLPRMSLRAGLVLSLPVKIELTTGSNCSGKRRHGEVLGMQLSKIVGLSDKKKSAQFFRSCIPVPLLWYLCPLNLG